MAITRAQRSTVPAILSGEQKKIDSRAQTDQKTASTWASVRTVFRTLGLSVSFFFFRIFEVIKPTLSPRLEVVWLRISEVWQRIKVGRRQKRLEEDVAQLREETKGVKAELAEVLQEKAILVETNLGLKQALSQAELDKGTALEENGRLKQQSEWVGRESNLVSEENTNLLTSQSLVSERQSSIEVEKGLLVQLVENEKQTLGSVEKERDLLVQKCEQMREQNELLSKERDEARAARDAAVLEKAQVVPTPAAVQQELDSLRAEVEVNGNLELLRPHLGKISAAVEQWREGRGEVQLVGIEAELETILPFLSEQEKGALETLRGTMPLLPSSHPALSAIQSLMRIIKNKIEVHDRIKGTFRFHSDVDGALARLSRPFRIEDVLTSVKIREGERS
jgi:chromosome segregation ATPase